MDELREFFKARWAVASVDYTDGGESLYQIGIGDYGTGHMKFFPTQQEAELEACRRYDLDHVRATQVIVKVITLLVPKPTQPINFDKTEIG